MNSYDKSAPKHHIAIKKGNALGTLFFARP